MVDGGRVQRRRRCSRRADLRSPPGPRPRRRVGLAALSDARRGDARGMPMARFVARGGVVVVLTRPPTDKARSGELPQRRIRTRRRAHRGEATAATLTNAAPADALGCGVLSTSASSDRDRHLAERPPSPRRSSSTRRAGPSLIGESIDDERLKSALPSCLSGLFRNLAQVDCPIAPPADADATYVSASATVSLQGPARSAPLVQIQRRAAPRSTRHVGCGHRGLHAGLRGDVPCKST